MCESCSPSRKLSANRTRTWTAPAAAVERERTRQIARIGNNPNQIARWANTYKTATAAVEVIAHLVAIERARRWLPSGAPTHDAPHCPRVITRICSLRDTHT